MAGGVDQVVEAGAAAGDLQAVDAAEAAVVEQDDDELVAEHHRGGELGVHHHVAAVAEHHHDLALGVGHLDAEAAGDLVAHGREAVFEVVAVGAGRCARACAARPAGRRRRRPRWRRRRGCADGADHLHVGGERVARGRGGDRVDGGGPVGLEAGVDVGGAVVAEERRRARRGRARASATSGQRVVLVGVVGRDVDRDEAAVRRPGRAPRSRW